MKGLSVQDEENLEADKLDSLAMWFPFGISSVKGSRGVCAQRNGRCRTSEKRFLQEILCRSEFDAPAKVECQVPCHVKDSGGDLRKRISLYHK